MSQAFDPLELRRAFPALDQSVNDRPLIYLDNGATSQTARAVLDAMDDYYQGCRANVHRAGHALAAKATTAFEQVRHQIAGWLRVESERAVIFNRGTTEAINLVAWGLLDRLGPGDEILVSTMEHHANLVPWQLVAQRSGARVRPIPLTQSGELDMAAYQALLGPRTRLVAVCHASNTLGVINPVARICELARRHGALSVIDGAQAAPHLAIDIQALGCDFYVFSGHKMFGPTGVGVLTGRLAALEQLEPWQGGGEMIDRVSFEGVTFNALPHRLEAGTPPIAEVIGLGRAVALVEGLGDGARRHEQHLLDRLWRGLAQLPVQLLGPRDPRVSLISLSAPGVHPGDLALYLDGKGIAVRAGSHCTQPLHSALGLDGSLRLSLAPYNTEDEVDQALAALAEALALFGDD
ncbi:cysteine desulfurase [Gallaecimonas sp. GXIMD4217]|uniref:aminotransferase class V-fold PLP-dependent enzyme n=1 Tax=Gallaecimonas sp. GXIMD4217 TaxID=3131927 RepID=UPI00311AE266